MLKQCSCKSLKGYLDVTHALSLNDTFWVKKDVENISWADVSLYRNSFDKMVSNMALNGKGYSVLQKQLSTPEFCTDGSFAKCWIRENGKIKLLKKGTSGFANAGLEPYSEFYASQVLDAFGVRHVKYDLGEKSGSVVAKCDLFTTEDYGLVSVAKLSKDIIDINTLVKFYRDKGLYNYIAELLVADSIIFNEDRHLGNLGFMFDNNTGNIVDTAPLYDHNISLLCYAMESDFKGIDNYLNSKGHKLSDTTFEYIAKGVLTPELRRRLINMYGFKFKKHKRFNLPDWRLEALEKLINRQIEKILK